MGFRSLINPDGGLAVQRRFDRLQQLVNADYRRLESGKPSVAFGIKLLLS
jgi:hypothetical protein